MLDPTTGITAADIEQAKREFERARFEKMQRITDEFREKYIIKDEHCMLEKRAYDLLQRAKARVRRNSEGMGG
jgi:hypothetical protein